LNFIAERIILLTFLTKIVDPISKLLDLRLELLALRFITCLLTASVVHRLLLILCKAVSLGLAFLRIEKEDSSDSGDLA
jgi:hypothetical protein